MMKKIIPAVLILLSTIVVSSCNKEGITSKLTITKLADKGKVLQADFIPPDPTTPPAISDKGNLSQADGEAGH